MSLLEQCSKRAFNDREISILYIYKVRVAIEIFPKEVLAKANN